LVSYLFDLGISDLYASPIFQARRGSLHGYSVTNPMEINPELGSRASFDALARRLKSRDMGLIIDVVPNHMALSHENPWWMDVLENGPSSPYAVFFDIEWHPPDRVLEGRVLLPILGKHYNEALENGELTLAFEKGGFFIKYFEHKFSLDPKSYREILSLRLTDLEKELGESNPAVIGLKGLVTMTDHLPARSHISRKKIKERQKDKEIIRGNLRLLYQGSPELREYIDENLRILNGEKGDPASFDLLDKLLLEQPYRLAFWQVALEMINYRRFFSINDLIGIRIEDPHVFEAFKHGLLFGLIEEGKVSGIRVDHIDGLYDPEEYLLRLQRLTPDAKQTGENKLYVVVEKIFGQDESLPPGWHVSGSTGYDYLNMVNGLFVDEQGYRRLQLVFAALTSTEFQAADIVYEKKKLVMETLFGGEIENLVSSLSLLASHDRQARDLPGSDLVKALVEVTACLPFYRTYIRSYTVSKQDRACLERTMQEVTRRNPFLNPRAVGFMHRLLLMDFQPYLTGEQKDERLDFVMRWQQFSVPIMAKGLEDTALYVYNPLISLNEVGSNLQPTTVEAFHRFNRARQRSMPFSMNATSTHDTKRSEDVRARINTLSEIVDEWEDLLQRWKALNDAKKISVNGKTTPDPNEEMFLYQTLIGAWPLRPEELPALRERLISYMVKALREAMVHSRWITPDDEYEKGLVTFTKTILDDAGENEFLKNFLTVQSRLAYHGALNSLSQLLLKITSPGVPDFYQGTELWDFSLVDPDNRRPVDFTKRARLLKELKRHQSKSADTLVHDLLVHWEDGRIKLYVTYKALNFRREHSELFLEGEYIPLSSSGTKQDHVIAFLRRYGDKWALVAVPRLTAKISPTGAPIGEQVWGKSLLAIPPEAPLSWTNIFTRQRLEIPPAPAPRHLFLSRVFSDFPIALLSSD
jgi:(1->4)-alpha-D-glucan 1-alpha-D-glucosylmutase